MKRFAFFEGQVGNPRSNSPHPTPSPQDHQHFENHADGQQHKTKQNTLRMGLGVRKNNNKTQKLRAEVYLVPKHAGHLPRNSSNAQPRTLLAWCSRLNKATLVFHLLENKQYFPNNKTKSKHLRGNLWQNRVHKKNETILRFLSVWYPSQKHFTCFTATRIGQFPWMQR